MRILRDALEALRLAKVAKDLFGEVFGSKLPPHVVRRDGGRLGTEPGWVFTSADPDDLSVGWSPGWVWQEKRLVAGESPGNWGPCEGYVWVNPTLPGCLEVRWEPGRPHTVAPHVVAASTVDKWRAEAGWHFLTRDSGDFRVEPDMQPESLSSGAIQRLKDLGTLGLDEGAAPAAIESAFRELAQVHHPDRFAGQGEAAMAEAQRRFLRLREARDRLLAGGAA